MGSVWDRVCSSVLETYLRCPADCGACCGNGVCDNGETCWTCAGKCGERFLNIEKRSFWVGSPAGCPGPDAYPGGCAFEPGRRPNENPHYVQLTYDFEVEVLEVMQGEWKEAFSGWNPSKFQGSGDTCPVEQVLWYDACAYANWKIEQVLLPACYLFSEVKCKDGSNVGSNYRWCLNVGQEGTHSATVALSGGVSKPYECMGLRLPTEAEWEYAARAGSLTPSYSSQGNDGKITETGWSCSPLDPNLDQIEWYCGNSRGKRQSVAGKEANRWGLKHMTGNVGEWC